MSGDGGASRFRSDSATAAEIQAFIEVSDMIINKVK